jgi:DoxX-like family
MAGRAANGRRLVGDQRSILGILKAAAAAGLLLGLFGATLIGTAAAIGLALYFVGAVAALLRARAYNQLGLPVPYLLLAIAALVLGLLASG